MKTKYRRYTIAKLYNNKFALCVQTAQNPNKYTDQHYSYREAKTWEHLFDTVEEARTFYQNLCDGTVKETYSLVEIGDWEEISIGKELNLKQL